jgi:hypothetical protein
MEQSDVLHLRISSLFTEPRLSPLQEPEVELPIVLPVEKGFLDPR